MLPACNRNVGENVCFPDTCDTPTGTGADAPIPYLNTGDNSQALAFATTVKVEGGNAIHLGTTIAQTSGDEAGTDAPSTKGKGAYTTGNPTVFIEKQMGVTLADPANGNSANAPGGVAVPSACSVFYSDASAKLGGRSLTGENLAALRASVAPCAEAVSLTGARPLADEARGDGAFVVRIARFTEDVPSRVVALARHHAAAEIVLDLTDNPGGDLGAAERLLDELLPAGAALFAVDRGDGDIEQRSSRGGALTGVSLCVRVNGGTASAAEAVVATLRAHARARIVGRPTYGKSTVQHVAHGRGGRLVFATVARILVPNASGGLDPLERITPDE